MYPLSITVQPNFVFIFLFRALWFRIKLSGIVFTVCGLVRLSIVTVNVGQLVL